MKINKKMLLTSTAALSVFAAFQSKVEANEGDFEGVWTPRSVEEIRTDLINQGDTSTYTVQYGDTLSTIAEAMGVDMDVLAKVNQIVNIDLIFPGTTITATYNEDQEATDLTIEGAQPAEEATAVAEEAAPVETTETPADETVAPAAPVAETPAPATETAPTATVDLQANEVTVGDTTTSLDDVEVSEQATPAAEATEAPAEEAVAPAAPAAETPAPATQEAPQVATAPVEEPETPVSETVQVPVETATTSAPVAPVASANNITINTAGMQPKAAAFANQVANEFGITNIGGYRTGEDAQDHGKGLAVDIMVPVGSDLGDQVAQYAIDHMAENGISYIIWEQQFYGPVNNIYGPANTWNPMGDRGSITQNHYDHVHVSFYE